MEKSNFINVIVSIILIVAGLGFVLYGLLAGNGGGEDILMMIIGTILVIYALFRIFITNHAAKEIS